MSALDDLQARANAASDALDGLDGTVADLGTDNDDLAQQFAGLGSEGSAQVLTHASTYLATVREHIANAKSALDEYISACEQAKGSGS